MARSTPLKLGHVDPQTCGQHHQMRLMLSPLARLRLRWIIGTVPAIVRPRERHTRIK